MIRSPNSIAPVEYELVPLRSTPTAPGIGGFEQ